MAIENVFGDVAWAKFLDLQPNDDIVVVGNGPVCSQHGDYIEAAKMVIRCNHYSEKERTIGEGFKKSGAKCNVQFICLHGVHKDTEKNTKVETTHIHIYTYTQQNDV